MSKHAKLKEIHAKLQDWCDRNGDDVLQSHCDELLTHITAEAEDTSDDSNPPGGPSNPPGTGN